MSERETSKRNMHIAVLHLFMCIYSLWFTTVAAAEEESVNSYIGSDVIDKCWPAKFIVVEKNDSADKLSLSSAQPIYTRIDRDNVFRDSKIDNGQAVENCNSGSLNYVNNCAK